MWAKFVATPNLRTYSHTLLNPTRYKLLPMLPTARQPNALLPALLLSA